MVYFYSDREQTVDLSVRFPGGLITEWYPQATQIGPSKLSTNSEGAQPAVTADSSIIRWPNVHVLANGGQSSSPNLAQDQSGSHYFTARQTDANIVEVQTGADNQVEREKFLFYRGVANFEAPLHVALDQSEAATLENRSGNPLADLFLLRVKDGRGQFVHVKKLGSGETRTVSVDLDHNGQLLAELDQRLGDEMARALVGQGLFEREAEAMVATWKDSWFEEPGIRVLYLLPRPWTDTVLPMKMTPVPTHLERVMVGRAELVPPGVEEELAKLVKQASKDPAANNRVQQIERELGRFAGPIVERASGSSYYE